MPSFKQAREFLLANRTAYDAALKGFQWPEPVPFNWALDWFDAELARAPDSKDRCGLWIVDVASGEETKLTFAGKLSMRSNQVANYLRQLGLKRGDHLLLVLNNVAPLWEIMLAAMKLGVVVIPATTLFIADELADRVERGRAQGDFIADEQQVRQAQGPGWREGASFADDQHREVSTAGQAASRKAYTMFSRVQTPDRADPRPDDALHCLYFTFRAFTAKPFVGAPKSNGSHLDRRFVDDVLGSG